MSEVMSEKVSEKKITIFTTDHCPRCKFLKFELGKLGIPVLEISDIDLMLGLSILSVPTMELPTGERLNYDEAMRMIQIGTIRQYM